MKAHKVIGTLSAAMIVVVTSAWAEKAKDPVVGGSLVEVNVTEVVATGYRASELVGADIYNDKGENIGKLDDFIVGSNTDVSIAVIAVGGYLGMGARSVAVPAALFERNDQDQTVLPGATKEQLEGLPEFRYVQ